MKEYKNLHEFLLSESTVFDKKEDTNPLYYIWGVVKTVNGKSEEEIKKNLAAVDNRPIYSEEELAEIEAAQLEEEESLQPSGIAAVELLESPVAACCRSCHQLLVGE